MEENKKQSNEFDRPLTVKQAWQYIDETLGGVSKSEFFNCWRPYLDFRPFLYDKRRKRMSRIRVFQSEVDELINMQLDKMKRTVR